MKLRQIVQVPYWMGRERGWLASETRGARLERAEIGATREDEVYVTVDLDGEEFSREFFWVDKADVVEGKPVHEGYDEEIGGGVYRAAPAGKGSKP